MSKTRVIHYRDRAQYDPDELVYIGRAMPRMRLQASPWANPYRIGKDGTREEVIERYAEDLAIRLHQEPGLWDELAALDGMVLMCWCKPDNCHGDHLAKQARMAREQLDREGDYWAEMHDAHSL